MTHIIIENAVCLNTGDAAIMLAIRHVLREALGNDIRFTVFDSDAEACARHYANFTDITFRPLLAREYRPSTDTGPMARLAAFRRRIGLFAARNDAFSIVSSLVSPRVAASLRAYRDANYVVTTGGTYLVENYDLDERFRQFTLDAYLAQSPIFYTQSLGPFTDARTIERLKPIIAASPLVLLRDEKSLKHLQMIGADTARCHVVADSVFALADQAKLQARMSETAAPSPPKRVAISVRDWVHFSGDAAEGMARYKQAVATLVEKLVVDGAEITFLSTCQGEPSYRYDDSKTAMEIAALLPDAVRTRVTVNRDYHRPDELLAILGDFDLVVATRMHMMILSLCCGVPVLPIAYEFKTIELSRRIGLDAYISDIDDVTSESLLARANAFTTMSAEARRAMFGKVMDEVQSAMSVVELVRRVPPRLTGSALRPLG